jgi:serine phosphatase RsbU (regulator of sigma subunit)
MTSATQKGDVWNADGRSTMGSEISSRAFQLAQLRSERARVRALLIVFGALLLLVLLRGVMTLAQGHRGEAWPFALLLAMMTGYEAFWLRLVERTIASTQEFSNATWITNVFIESLLPTAALLLQVQSSFVGPDRALMSPVVLTYALFIILSTLHLNPVLSSLAGLFSAAGYAAVSIYLFLMFPQAMAEDRLMAYGASLTAAAILLLSGVVAGTVARQIRLHVLAALREAESRAKVAQLEHDLGIARSIQQGLLPKAEPAIEGFDVAGWNQPADETGGDYYDWQSLSDGRVAITIADVTGHGIGSALCMAACRSYVRSGLANGPDLHSLLTRMNQLLYADLPSERFVTLAAGLLKPSDATLQLISAGHGPLLFYSAAENRFRTLDAQGLPLGLLPRANYCGPTDLRFQPGDILVLVTDGFVEWANENEEDFGEDRLKHIISSHSHRSAATIISELYSAVVKFAGPTPQLDDLTALVVKRL